MDNEPEFKILFEQWKAHCDKVGANKDLADYTNCLEYREILSKGREVLPYVHRLYETNDDLDFPTFAMNHLVDGLIGRKVEIPVWCENIRDIRHHYASTLERYASAHV
jgi:hypothetical protein